jgi:FolB domain-containing protein
MDRILIRDLRIRCVLGTGAQERRRRQDVVVNVALDADLRRACRSDRLADTVDYGRIADRVTALITRSRFHLVEALAGAIARTCLAVPGVRAATVRVDKPAALASARSAAVEITRRRTPRTRN